MYIIVINAYLIGYVRENVPYMRECVHIVYMKGWKGDVMAKVTTKEAIKLTANYSGYSIDVVEAIIKSYTYIVHRLLLEGYETRMPNLGRFYLKDMAAKPAREWTNPITGQKETLKAKSAYQKPDFKFLPTITKEIRNRTEGNLL